MNNGHGGFPKNNGHGGFSKNNGHGGVRVQKPVAQGHHDMKSFEIKLGPPQGKYRPGAWWSYKRVLCRHNPSS